MSEEEDVEEQIPLYDPSVVQQSNYEMEPIKIINDIARDESLPNIIHYVHNVSQLSNAAKSRIIAKAACFLSKNHVYSFLTSDLDFQRAQDDYEFAKIVSRVGLNSFDRNIDYLTAESLIEAQHSIRLRRSRDALNLKSLNTTRNEQIMSQNVKAQEEDRRLRSRIPLIGGL